MIRLLPALALALVAVSSTAVAIPAPAPYDVVIRNGLVYDGSGAPLFAADVAVTGARIAAIAPPDAVACGSRPVRLRSASGGRREVPSGVWVPA
jgi:N-acyl-D-amino-acid deacylase